MTRADDGDAGFTAEDRTAKTAGCSASSRRREARARYATPGFSDQGALDDGPLWPTSYALTDLTPRTRSTLATPLSTAVS